MKHASTDDQDIAALSKTLAEAARASNQRRGLIVAGDHSWCRQTAQAVLSITNFQRVLWISTKAPAHTWSMPAAKTHALLGRELDAVVFDAHCGFDLDAFGAISGTVHGGGLLLLLTPRFDDWAQFRDPENARITVALYELGDVTGRFFRHMVGIVRDSVGRGIEVIEQHKSVGATLPENDVSNAQSNIARHRSTGEQFEQPLASKNTQKRIMLATPSSKTAMMYDAECRTADQRRAVVALVKVITGHRRRPVVLTSDRGRGKSTALGIAAAHLLKQGIKHIVVTGPRLESVRPVFEHASRLLPEARASKAALHLGKACLEFLPPDQLAHALSPVELLLVDEAATIPTPVLERLLEHYSRIAFATTIHGYEGTGRGFAIRFNKVLDQRTRGWKAIRLETPIRWAANDPLERFVFRALLLDAAAAPDEAIITATRDHCVIERVDRDVLVDDGKTLYELFGLLILAHYRTRPYDLRHMLDGPNLSIYTTRYQGHVVATALVAHEGGFDTKTSRAVWEGRTRPHGHLIPESLAAHVGLEYAPIQQCARIMRIAVHPAVQGRGLGTQLTEAIVKQARDERLDYVGSSFGATDELLAFWARARFVPVRLSVKRGATSGAHSAILLRALSDPGGILVAEARERFIALLPHQLSDPLRDLEPRLAVRLIRHTRAEKVDAPQLSCQDWSDIVAFAFAKRVYEVCIAPLWKLTSRALADPNNDRFLKPADRNALIVKVLQKRTWRETAVALGLAGRADVIEALRHAAQTMALHYGDASVQAQIKRLISTSTPSN